ncbi:MAG TPA: hypothetical protein VIA06_09715 [Candidatus Dormibacteraeota bacterium]|nr:hypothetical protein [Candidatus Dormibacteraeota bacterium]
MNGTISMLGFFHGRLAIALLLFAFALAVWGTVAYVIRRRVSPGYRSSFLIMIGLTAVQGLLGLAALILGGRPHEILHVVYGIFAVLFLPAIFFWVSRGGESKDALAREALFMTIASWVVAVAYVRGFMTGS